MKCMKCKQEMENTLIKMFGFLLFIIKNNGQHYIEYEIKYVQIIILT